MNALKIRSTRLDTYLQMFFRTEVGKPVSPGRLIHFAAFGVLSNPSLIIGSWIIATLTGEL